MRRRSGRVGRPPDPGRQANKFPGKISLGGQHLPIPCIAGFTRIALGERGLIEWQGEQAKNSRTLVKLLTQARFASG
jgi:hypothetical protein